MERSLIDAGPLIALFDKDDKYHKSIKEFLATYNGRLFTSWAVITEAMYMLDFDIRAQVDLLNWIQRDALEIPVISKLYIPKIIEVSKKYSDVPMDFADATLMVISEMESIGNIITIDSDFNISRDSQKKALKNIFI
ncbi:MAG: PIN domain-containing protein [Thermoanaerobacteraceae bacterium]|nr:PIN domain-containing protein [Thermoanaerobacteraceae bacterium]